MPPKNVNEIMNADFYCFDGNRYVKIGRISEFTFTAIEPKVRIRAWHNFKVNRNSRMIRNKWR